MKRYLLLIMTLLLQQNLQAKIKSEVVTYKEGTTTLEGYFVHDDAIKKNKPVILIVHQWMGLTDYEKSRAEQLAKLGYAAFAIDVYGKGVRPKNTEEAGKLATLYKTDRQLFKAREIAAYNFVKNLKGIDTKKIFVIGYCFGGTGALELARSGVDLAGVASFHGGLSSANPKEATNIKAPVMIFHGAIDPYVPASEVNDFMKEMNDAKVDYQFVAFSGAVHAFTQKMAGNDITQGAAYNEVADHRSWAMLESFLKTYSK